jgi:hypothetical protein
MTDFADISALHEFLKTPDVMGLPLRIAQQGQSANPWWEHVELVTCAAIELDIWSVAQACAVVFEAYPDLVEKIDLNWSVESRKNGTYADCVMRINGRYFHPDSPELDAEILEKMEAIDDFKALHGLFDIFEGSLHSSYLQHVNRLWEAFPEPITSAEEARSITRKVKPEMLAAFDQMLLDRQTAPGGPAAPRVRM